MKTGATTIREFAGLFLLAAGILLIILGLRVLLQPTTYQAFARIRIERDPGEVSAPGDARSSSSYDPHFLQTEMEVVQSELILGKVIDQLDLGKQWGMSYGGGGRLRLSECLQLLRGRLELRPVPGTTVLEVQVRSDKAEESAQLANAIAQAYRVHRQQRRSELNRGGLQDLEEAFAEQEAKIGHQREQVEALRRELKEPPGAPGEADLGNGGQRGFGPIPGDEGIFRLESERLKTKAEFTRQMALLSRLRRLQQENGTNGLVQALPTVMEDAALGSFLEQLGTAEQQFISASKEYGPQHTQVLRLQFRVADLQKRIQDRVEGILLGLETKVLSLSNTAMSLEREIGNAYQQDAESAKRSKAYREALRKLDELQRFRQVLETRMLSEKVGEGRPRSSSVEILDTATPARRPVSPSVPRAVTLMGTGFTLDIVGLLLLMGRPGGIQPPKQKSSGR